MEELIEITIVALSGEVLARRSVPAGHSVAALRKDIAGAFGYPPHGVKLLHGAAEMRLDLSFFLPETLLTCIFAAPPLDSAAFRSAVSIGEHGYVQAMMRAAEPGQLRDFLLVESGPPWYQDDPEVDLQVQATSALQCASRLEVLAVLVEAAGGAGLLQECLLACNDLGKTALHNAMDRGHEQVRLLLSAAAQAGCVRQLLLAFEVYGRTVVHAAAWRPDAEALECVLAVAKEHGLLAELLDARSHGGRTALWEAVDWRRVWSRGVRGAPMNVKTLLSLLRAAAEGGLLEGLLEERNEEGVLLRSMVLEVESEEVQQVLRESLGGGVEM